MRTNQALLKRLDSIGSVFNKTSNNAHANIAFGDNYYSGISSYVSQASKRFGWETPMFRNDAISRKDMSEIDDKMSTTFDIADGKGVNNQNASTIMNSQNFYNSANINYPFAKSEVSVVSVNEIWDFEDYIPFRSTFNLEKIDEEKPVGLEEQVSMGGEGRGKRKKPDIDFNLKEARMSEEDSYDGHKHSKITEEDEDDNESEYRDDLDDPLKPRKSSTIKSSQFNDRHFQFQTKLSTLYRQGTGNSEITIVNSQKGGVKTSIWTSKDGTKSDALINPKTLEQRLKKKMSMHFPSAKLKSRNTLKFKSSNSSHSNSKILSLSYRKSNIFKLGIPSQVPQSLSNYNLFTSQSQKQIGNTNVKDIVIILFQMGFEDEKVERALFHGEVKSVEEAMYFLVPNKDGFWECKLKHKKI